MEADTGIFHLPMIILMNTVTHHLGRYVIRTRWQINWKGAGRYSHEGYYTQHPPHYPPPRVAGRSPSPPLRGRSPPPPGPRSPPPVHRLRTPPPRIIDVDSWSTASYTPPSSIRRLSPSSRPQSTNYDSIRPRHFDYGSREKPICVDDHPEAPQVSARFI